MRYFEIVNGVCVNNMLCKNSRKYLKTTFKNIKAQTANKIKNPTHKLENNQKKNMLTKTSKA